MENLTPRPKTVEPVQADTTVTVNFSRVLANRCASNEPYRFVFEAVRGSLRDLGLSEVENDFEQGFIKVRFRWLILFAPVLAITFYSAGISTVLDADSREKRGWFKWARRRKGEKLIQRLCEAPMNSPELQSAAEAHSKSVRPPGHEA